MARHHLINGIKVAFTAEEETAWDNAETAWNNGALSRAQANLRSRRNGLLAETDFYALSDLTMSDEWKNYRQALRDITKQTPTDDALSNITWPKKPE